MNYFKSFFLAVYCIVPTAHCLAYEETLDKIVAVVGSSIILEKEVNEVLFMAVYAPTDSVRKEILTKMIENRLLVAMALQESLFVVGEEIAEALQNAMLAAKGRFPSDELFEQELRKAGLTEQELRQKYKEEMEDNFLIRKLIEKELGVGTMPTDIEARIYYRENRDSIPNIPASCRFICYAVPYKLSDKAREITKEKADKVMRKLKRGEKFEKLALKYSDDPISRERGGFIGTFSKEDMQAEFRDFVETLKIGEIDILEKEDAYHILLREQTVSNRISLRDIVIKILPIKDDSLNVERIAESVKEAIEDDEPTSIHKYAEDIVLLADSSQFVPLSQTPLPQELETVQIQEVYILKGDNCLYVVKVLERSEERFPGFDEIRMQIKQYLQQERFGKVYKSLVKEAREKIYVKISL